MKLALAIIVKSSDEEAEMLSKCLSYTAPFVDGIFITITYTDEPNEKVKEVAEMYGANISYFEWVDHFSKARNFNFSQVPEEYTHILWLDADDAIRGAEKLKKTIKENPHADAFAFYYLYAFDEYKNPVIVHQKTQVVKNDGCVEWAGAVHEDFKKSRNVQTFFVEGIERIHLSSETRAFEAGKRNLRIAEKEVNRSPDDPRSYWNLGNSLKARDRHEEAIDTFKKFMRLSESDDEKYIVYLRMAECYWQMDEFNKATDELKYAIGLKPEYPDAYHLAGSIYFSAKRFKDAERYYLLGLPKRPPYYEIIVYNPRDYDYNPLMNLAKTYFKLSRPDMALICLKKCKEIQPKNKSLNNLIDELEKEKKEYDEVLKEIVKLKNIKDKKELKNAINRVPNHLKSHPMVCQIRNTNFIKKESSGKDIVYFCGYTVRQWNPEVAEKEGIGGSEEAVINLSKRWAKEGWNVEVYNNCPGHTTKEFDGVTYKPFWMWNYRDKKDITVLWRSARPADYGINTNKLFIDVHDVIGQGEFNKRRLKEIDKVMVKSEFHRSLFPNIPDNKIAVVPNGINPEDFKEEKRDKDLIINTSSPDRSLSAFIDIFKEIKKKVPTAKAKWAYGWGVFDVVHGDSIEIMEWKKKQQKKMKDIGIEEMGMINHDEVAKLYNTANVFLYPTEFAEIHCISAAKAQAGGAIPITTNFSALDETVKYGVKINSKKTKDSWCPPGKYDYSIESKTQKDRFIKETVELLKSPIKEREDMKKWAKKTYNWENVSNQWLNIFS